MRSRPIVKAFLRRTPLEAGERFVCDLVLTSKSRTPTDFVDVRFEGETMGAIQQGKAVQMVRETWLERTMRWSPGTLEEGEYRQRFEFDVPPGSPPTYGGRFASVQYQLRVHVSIPYWPDRNVRFILPVAAAARMPAPVARGALVATHPGGPVAKQPYIELGIDATQLARGEVLKGDVSFANVKAKRIRRVMVSLVGRDCVRHPGTWQYTSAAHSYLLVSGEPLEGESYPFRITIPKELTPSFDARLFELRWALEVRADVLLGQDVVVSAPLEIVRPPPNVELPARTRPALSVGRERVARLWGYVAQEMQFDFDPERGAMLATSGPVTMELRREAHQGTLGTTAVYRWPHLGLDVHIGEQGFLDSMTKRGYFTPRLEAAKERFTIVGREPAQLESFCSDALLGLLVTATSVELDDDGATIHFAGTANTTSSLERVAQSSRQLLDLFAGAQASVSPPASIHQHVDAWRAFAERVAGRLELGRLWVHDATLGAFRFEAGVAWEPASPVIVGTVVRFAIEPPLARAPAIDDPALSAVARERLRELVSLPHFHASTDEIGFVMPGVVADPATLEPKLQIIAALLRALRGLVAAGPFR